MEITKKLQKKLRSEWLKALESGEYKQCSGQLQGGCAGGGVGYCCLGVAAKTYQKLTGAKLEPLTRDSDLDGFPEVVTAFGLRSETGTFYVAIDKRVSLIACNDGDKYLGLDKLSFKQIAKLIRANRKLVFVD